MNGITLTYWVRHDAGRRRSVIHVNSCQFCDDGRGPRGKELRSRAIGGARSTPSPRPNPAPARAAGDRHDAARADRGSSTRLCGGEA